MMHTSTHIPIGEKKTRQALRLMLLLSLLLCSILAPAQTSYRWTGGGGNSSYGTAANWTPARTTAAPSDILIFDINATVLSVPTQTIRQLRIINNAVVTFQAVADQTTLSFGTAGINSMELTTGTLQFTGSFSLHLALAGNLSITGKLAYSSLTAQKVVIKGNLSGTGTISMLGTNLAHELTLEGALNTLTTLQTNASATVSYTANVAQDVFGASYPNLSLSGTGLKTLKNHSAVISDFTLESGTTLEVGTYDLTVTGESFISGKLNNASATGLVSLQKATFYSGGSLSGVGKTYIYGQLTVAALPGRTEPFLLEEAEVRVFAKTTIIDGNLSFNKTVGIKVFSDLEIQEGSFSNNNAEVTLNGSLLISRYARFTSGSGRFVFTGTKKIISCGQALVLNSAQFRGIYTAIGTDIQVLNPEITSGAVFSNKTAAFPLILPGTTTERAFNNYSLPFVNKFNYLGADGTNTVTAASSGKDSYMSFTRNGTGMVYGVRTKEKKFDPTPTSALIRFDLSVLSSATQAGAAYLSIGSGFDSTNVASLTATARIGFNLRAGNNLDITHPDGSVATIADANNASIWWIMNNTTDNLVNRYTGPDGVTHTVLKGQTELWVIQRSGTSTTRTKVWTQKPIVTTTTGQTDLKFVFSQGSGTIGFKNLTFNPITNIEFERVDCWSPGAVFAIPFSIDQGMVSGSLFSAFNYDYKLQLELSDKNGNYYGADGQTVTFPYDITYDIELNPKTGKGTAYALIPASHDFNNWGHRFRLMVYGDYPYSYSVKGTNNKTLGTVTPATIPRTNVEGHMYYITSAVNPQVFDPNKTTGTVITSSVAAGSQTSTGFASLQWGFLYEPNGTFYALPGQTGTSYTPKTSDFPGKDTYYLVCRKTVNGNSCISNYITLYINCATNINLIRNGTFDKVGTRVVGTDAGGHPIVAWNDLNNDGVINYKGEEFATQYIPTGRTSAPQMIEGGYNIATNPAQHGIQDWCSPVTTAGYVGGNPNNFPTLNSSPSGGNFLLANGTDGFSQRLWEQYVENLKPETDYVLTFWAAGVSTRNPRSLNFGVYINCRRVGDDITDRYASQCGWAKYAVQFNSGALREFTVSINNITSNGSGNDIAIDDIEFYECGGTDYPPFIEFVWRGYDNDWFNPDNWGTCDEIPACDDKVVIPAGKRNYPIIDNNSRFKNYTWNSIVQNSALNGVANAGDLTVEKGASITITTVGSLKVCGNISNEGMITGDGILYMDGNSDQFLSGRTGSYNNMQIDHGGLFAIHFSPVGTTIREYTDRQGNKYPSTVTINGRLMISMDRYLELGKPLASGASVATSSHTLILNGTLSSVSHATGKFRGSNLGTLIINGDGDLGNLLRIDESSPEYGSLKSLVLNRDQDGSITLANPLKVIGESGLVLQKGILYTSKTPVSPSTRAPLLTLSTTATVRGSSAHVSGGSDESHISGPMAKEFASTAYFTYPVGHSRMLGEIGFAPSFATPVTFQASFFKQNPANQIGAAYETPVSRVSSTEYWTLDRTQGTESGKISLHYTAQTDPWVLEASLTPAVCRYGAKFNDQIAGTNLTNGVWRSKGNNDSSPRDVKGYVSSDVISFFSPFAIGVTPLITTPLPVELLSLKAKAESSVVGLSWTTASEHNSSYFKVMRSSDGKSYREIGQVEAAGKSSSLKSYSFTDHSPLPVNYYKLLLVDADGKTSPSKVVSASLPKPVEHKKLYPNPTDGRALYVQTAYRGKMQISIYDVIGHQVENFSVNVTSDEVNLLRSSLPKGVYVISMQYGKEVSHHKIIIN